MIDVWVSTPHDPSCGSLVLKVAVSNQGEITILDRRDGWYGRIINIDEIDDLIAALHKAKKMAPQIADAYQCEKRAEEMVKQAREDRLAAIRREAEL